MSTPRLTLIESPREPDLEIAPQGGADADSSGSSDVVSQTASSGGPPPSARLFVPLLTVLVLFGAAWGVIRDSDRPDLDAFAEATREIVRSGNGAVDDESVADANRQRLINLRDALARRPLDGKGRSFYAVALLAASQTRFDDTAAARFHARAARNTAPVTVSVVSRSARVLALSGEFEEGLSLITDMFEWAPEDAAETLIDIAPWADATFLLNRTPEALIARDALARELITRGRAATAADVDRDSLTHWPDDLDVLRRNLEPHRLAGDWAALLSVLDAGPDLQPSPETALLLTYRALAEAHLDRDVASREHIDSVLALGTHTRSVHVAIGDVLLELEDADGAQRQWRRALFTAPPRDATVRVPLLVRLARLETERGSASAAVDRWREVLALDPEHRGAQAALRELLGDGVDLR